MKLHDIVQGLKKTMKGGMSAKRRKIQKIINRELKDIDELTKRILNL